jgi:hypothetical protein
MKYFVMLNHYVSNVEMADRNNMPGGMMQWQWNTMNGNPVGKAGCKRCSAKDNWGVGDMADMKDKDEMDDDEEEWKIMHVSDGFVSSRVFVIIYMYVDEGHKCVQLVLEFWPHVDAGNKVLL